MLFIADTQRGLFIAQGQARRMAIGKSGAAPAEHKHEGDGKTPLGRYRIEHGFYRPDRMNAPISGVPLHGISQSDGWCDAPGDPRYNDHVTLPYEASHEPLQREDALYDLVFVLSHNRWPSVPGYGSAIFLHVAETQESGALKPTLGCLALQRGDLLAIAPLITPQSWLIIR
jgi:L,D-peptidoglycan transpeptidase YkuD (ErfK/YbiS/YcfS/YnhG family)